MKIQYVKAGLMLAIFGFGSNLYAENSNNTVKLYVSVLDEDLNYVDGVNKNLIVEDVRGKKHFYMEADQKREYTFNKGSSATFYVVKPSTSNVGYKKSPDYKSVYLTRATAERDIVLLPKGTKKVSNATALKAPVVAYLTKTSAEVNMQPFAGVDYKNRKDLSVLYQVVAKKVGAKASITKETNNSKVTFSGLTKGAWTFKYYVRFVDKKGKRIAGTKHYSPTTKAYLGYDYNIVSDASELRKPQTRMKLISKHTPASSMFATYDYSYQVTLPSYRGAILDNKGADYDQYIDIYKIDALGDYNQDTEGMLVKKCKNKECVVRAKPFSAYKAIYKVVLSSGKKVYSNEISTLWRVSGRACAGSSECLTGEILSPVHTPYVYQLEDQKNTIVASYGASSDGLCDFLVRDVKDNSYMMFTNVSSSGLTFSKANNAGKVTYLQNGEKITKSIKKGDYEVQGRYGLDYSWGGTAEFAIE